MKKLAIALLVALLLPLVACADSLMSVSDLRAQVEASGGRWTQTYQTARGESIVVDVPIEVPDVEAFPIIKATWMQRMPDEFKAEYGANRSDRPEPRWLANIDRYGVASAAHDYGYYLSQSEVKGKHFSLIGEDLLHNILPMSDIYAYNSALPADEAYDFLKGIVQECYERYGMSFNEPYLNFIRLNDLLCDGTSYRGTGEVFFKCYETLRGIPILTNVGKECNLARPFYELCVISKDSYQFRCQLYDEIAMLTDDVPLLSFDEIKPTFEKILNEGFLKDVYFLRLGYIAVYEEGKNENEIYRLLPCWVLTGEYYESAKDEAWWQEWQSTKEAEITPIMNRGATKDIIVNAQTGKIISPDASNSENRKLFSVKTW